MIQMILSEEQQRLLTNAKESVEIVDRSGRRLTTVRGGLTDADVVEILTRSRSSGDGVTLSDLVKSLTEKFPVPK